MATAVIIGGGAAGYFAAITCAEQAPGHQVIICEATQEVLAKVRISGGGRCNVTHHCLDPQELVGSYPRGALELRGPFARFGPADVIAWFTSRGVALKTEADGRMFPESDQSQSIIDCLVGAAQAAQVELRTGVPVRGLAAVPGGLRVATAGPALPAQAVLLASGSSRHGHALAVQLGHALVAPVPSLFTFTCPEPWLRALSGLSVEHIQLSLLDLAEPVMTVGPLLCTHWGLSGPAVLRASAWGARLLSDAGYRCRVRIDWLAGASAAAWIDTQRQGAGRRLVRAIAPPGVPRRLWEALCAVAGIPADGQWAHLTAARRTVLEATLNACDLAMTGKAVFKEEFVTAGGIARQEVHWRTMESRRTPGLYFAGECLDVDAITGGFNFQNAWTTGFLAGQAMAARLRADPDAA